MRVFGFFIFSCLSFALFAVGLPPEHEAARLNLAIETSVEKQEWAKAYDLIGQLRAIDVSQTTESKFYEGLVLFKIGRHAEAQEVLERYVVEAGKKGSFYVQALELITMAIERSQSFQEPTPQLSQITSAIPERQDRQGYVRTLQALYMTDSPVDALLMQVNSLLSSHPYTGERLKRSSTKKGIAYKLSIKSGALVVQEKNYQDGAPTLRAFTLNVLGVDPYLDFKCSQQEYACWLLDPVEKHKPWLFFDYDELIAAELAQAMSELILQVQKR